MTGRSLLELAVLTAAQGSALALAAWILTRTLLRRARPGAIAAVWTVVLVKFLVPFGPAMPYSLSDLIEALREGSHAPAGAGPIVAAPVAAAHAHATWSIVAIAVLAVWLAIAGAIAFRAIRRSRAAIRAARSLPPALPGLVSELAVLARRLRAPLPELRIAADKAPPHVVGLRRPIIVLPTSLTGPHRAADRAAVLSHELAHLRRRDPWVAVIQAAAGALLWWWPVVAWVNRRIVAARESACDAWAVARGPLPREQYARLLLSFARTPAPLAGAALAARAGGLGARIDALLDRRARPGVGPAGVALLVVWIVVGLGGARPASAREAGRTACMFSPAVATTLLAAHPEADLDGDGTLSRAEACELQAELRRVTTPIEALALDTGVPSAEDAAVKAALAEPICCNCQGGEGMSLPSASPVIREQACVIEGDSP